MAANALRQTLVGGSQGWWTWSLRYTVVIYEPQKRVRFQLIGPSGFNGFHEFEVTDSLDGACLRHVIEADMRGLALMTWPLVFRPLHDALLEDALDKAERDITGMVANPNRWSWRVRFLRRMLERSQG